MIPMAMTKKSNLLFDTDKIIDLRGYFEKLPFVPLHQTFSLPLAKTTHYDYFPAANLNWRWRSKQN